MDFKGELTHRRANHTPRTSFRQTVGQIFRLWWWEILTWSVGTIATLTIILILIAFNNKPFSMWHSRVSLNAIISALSQLSQSALIVAVASCIGQQKWTWFKTSRKLNDLKDFDDASRGPEGSLRFLFKHPSKYTTPLYF